MRVTRIFLQNDVLLIFVSSGSFFFPVRSHGIIREIGMFKGERRERMGDREDSRTYKFSFHHDCNDDG